MKKSTIAKIILSAVWIVGFLFVCYLSKEPVRWYSTATWMLTVIFVAVEAIISSLCDEYANYDSNNGYAFSAALWLITIVIFAIWLVIRIGSTDLFHSIDRYQYVKNMVTVIEQTDEVSAFPNLLGENNDTSNLPLIGTPEAIKRAETEMGKKPALGSQFEIKESEITSQNINGSLMYVVPLEPKSWVKWDSSGNRGYFIIDRNNGNTTYCENSLYTTEKAPFGSNAKRILNSFMKNNGINGKVTEISPEVDDEGNFFYVATVYNSTGIEGLDKVMGVIELNPYNTSCKYYPLGDIPSYIDRVFPEKLFTQYLKYYGKYAGGFWNSVIGQKNVQEPTSDFDVIYIDGVCYYYTGFTATGKGESSNGIMMMNCRTGEITYYVTYGISEARAMGVAEGRVQEKGYKAAYPLLLMVGNEETYLMIMRDANKNLVGYSFVNYKDYTKASVSEDLLSAQAEYIKACATVNSASSLNNDILKSTQGVILDIVTEVVDGSTMYYVILDSQPMKVFMFRSTLWIDILFAEDGDKLQIEYIDSDDRVISAVTVSEYESQ